MQIPGSATWLATVQHRRAQTYAGFAAQLGVTDAAYHAAVDSRVVAWVTDKQVRVRVRVDVLPFVLDDGRLKNQFETATSGGALNPAGRIATEAALFDIPPMSPGRDRPIYGYLEGSAGGSLRQYGLAVLCLREDVRARTTFTLADSLDHTRFGTLPYVAAVQLTAPTCDAAYTEAEISTAANVAAATGYGYVECQIHGGVAVADVERVVFTHDIQPDPDVMQKLDDVNLEFDVVGGDEP